MDIQEIRDIVQRVVEEVQKNMNSPKNDTAQTKEEVIHFPEGRIKGVDKPHNAASIERAQSITPARIGIGRTGTRMLTTSYLQFLIDHAAAQDAVLRDVSDDFLQKMGLHKLETQANDMKSYLMDLDAGRKLSDESMKYLEQNGDKGKNVQIIVCDGLSSSAVEANVADLLPALIQGLKLKNISVATPFFIKRGRVWVQDEVAAIVNCDLVISLIGERPGLNTDESLSAYMIYRPTEKTVEADRTVISNIHKDGLTSLEAGAYLSDLIEQMLLAKCTGVSFAQQRNINI
ncbi:ethanolamine ammonia lyase small subunit [Lysinibacillus sp. KCTC 33748]|uniref:ethanolamine ammonia-lyase subunit EutC n=1 Tax=unclassified Lysinibacillus TaxID=2636778 RepID=UPI0009A8FD06|nr:MULTISPECIES: ethanolamine ammonia-lyase subunit EutC [unclassified Lysinibacillus]OXS75973.1 ethanolamine ammonia lyase small subunit [Lysinibacillus sp. KCTC 33748]SKB37489.1 Ethanolamine ammonia-lyase light chain [Lysinibacillus sp. AC-3]